MADWTVETRVTPMSQEQHRQLRHHPGIVAALTQLANQIVAATGSPTDFEVLVQNMSQYQRARAFAKPATGRGIRLELRDSVLIKSISTASGQGLTSTPPSEYTDAANQGRDFSVSQKNGVKQQ